MSERPGIRWRVEGAAGRITLDRPEALNALDHAMVHAVDAALDDLEADPAVSVVVLDAAGDRAFCAGGDIVALHDAARAGDPSPRRFWADEYRLDHRLATFPKPIVALMDGIVMGGGVGLGGHVSHRVVTDRSVVAMPEVGIGFAPDVGGTWLLSRAPGELGTHLALTAGRMRAADAIHVGLADAHVPVASLPRLVEDLVAGGEPTATIERWATDPGASDLERDATWVDPCYRHDRVEEIVAALRAAAVPEAATAADAIEANSPTAVTVTLRALRTARTAPSLGACLQVEHRVSSTFLDVADFVEGIRAQVIDKDRSPAWNPADLASVDPASVDRFFVARDGDLDLDLLGAPS